MGIRDGLPDSFFENFFALVRLEPRSRLRDFSEGVAAKTADPLWMLARQWQMGELKADNAGSPLKVELTYRTQAVEVLQKGNVDEVEQLNGTPVETMIEREIFPMTWRERVRIGQEFERRARQTLGQRATALIDLYRKEYGIKPPPAKQWIETDHETRRFIRLMTDKVIDGKKLLDSRTNPTPIDLPSGIGRDEVEELFSQLKTWRAALYSEPAESSHGNAWASNQLAYRFELNPPPSDGGAAKTHLVAEDYRSGDFDWYSVNGKTKLRGPWVDVPEPIKAYATRITIGGTSLRWWAFEDAKTDFGDLDVGTPDLAKMLLMEFVFAHGDDWFSVPLPVEVGQLTQISGLKVYNVFGEDPIEIPSARHHGGDPLQRWEVFTIAGEGEYDEPGIGDCLYVPRVSIYREESPPLEEVRFLRDEGANMVWGVEHLLPNGLGRPVRGFEAQLERHDREREAEKKRLEDLIEALEEELITGTLSDSQRDQKENELNELRAKLDQLQPPSMTPSPQAALKYRLSTTVPDNWIPFVPAQASPENAPRPRLRLNRSQMLRNTADELPMPIPALSRLLGTWRDPLLWLDEYVVARAGVRVLLTKQRARDASGRTFVWLGKKMLTGRGEGSSGLRFDIIGGKSE
jgi:hypothetical protein